MDVFLLISLFYAVIGIRMVRQIWRERRAIFDDRYTPQDRMLIGQAAFFVLIPISVAFHELGHAAAIWSFGGQVQDFGYYLFAGWVSYAEPFTASQELVVTLAGTLVNLAILAVVMAIVLLKRPPFRAPINDLLITFAVLQAVNALVFYPLLDYATNMNGDWMQIYGTDASEWRMPILVAHIGLLVGMWQLSKRRSFRLRLGALTGMAQGGERGLLGDIGRRQRQPGQRPTASRRQPAAAPAAPASPRLSIVEERMLTAGRRVCAGWPTQAAPMLRSTPGASEMHVVWAADGMVARMAMLRVLPDGSGELHGAVVSRAAGDPAAHRETLVRWSALPDENTLTLALRQAMEQIQRWPDPVTFRA